MSARLYGFLAEFATSDQLLESAKAAREAGFTVEAYAPFPLEGIAEAVGFTRNRVPLFALLGGITGGVVTYFLLWYTAVIDYPINVGGRPLNSWPSFIPPTFEITILGAAFAAAIGMLVMNGLPRLRHPLFDMPDFDLASRNRFFLVLCASGPDFDGEKARKMLEERQPLLVREVPA